MCLIEVQGLDCFDELWLELREGLIYLVAVALGYFIVNTQGEYEALEILCDFLNFV